MRRTEPGPKLTWEKQSYKRYSAIVPGANAHIEVVRSGRARKMNERWHPHVFGAMHVGPGDGFETVTEAEEFAETTAIAYALATLEAFKKKRTSAPKLCIEKVRAR